LKWDLREYWKELSGRNVIKASSRAMIIIIRGELSRELISRTGKLGGSVYGKKFIPGSVLTVFRVIWDSSEFEE
jgi:hypothetical protein